MKRRLIRPAGMVVVAAVVGFVLARTLESGHGRLSDALTRTATAPTFSLRFPGDWTRVDPPPLAGLVLGARIAIAPDGSSAQRLAIGTADATTVGTLPAAFLASLPGRPSPEIVSLGAYRFDRYLTLRPRNSHELVSVYLLATTRATIVATCVSPHGSGPFTAACERVLRTLRLGRGVRASAGVDAAYALELNEILATLNEARRADGPKLADSSLATRALAARGLAGAETTAARAAARLNAGIATAANTTLATALHRAAGGYLALARAADAHDPTGYEAAQRTLKRAQSMLTGAFKMLARLGYRLG
jgi:hypothetical protein